MLFVCWLGNRKYDTCCSELTFLGGSSLHLGCHQASVATIGYGQQLLVCALLKNDAPAEHKPKLSKLLVAVLRKQHGVQTLPHSAPAFWQVAGNALQQSLQEAPVIARTSTKCCTYILECDMQTMSHHPPKQCLITSPKLHPAACIAHLYTTAMLCAFLMVDSLCATTTLVRPRMTRSSASCSTQQQSQTLHHICNLPTSRLSSLVGNHSLYDGLSLIWQD